MKKILLSATAVGLVLAFTAREAQAGGYPVFDALLDAAVEAMQKALDSAITGIGDKITGAVSDMNKSVNQVLTDGFTQEANYSKAQIGAQEQITDASNMAMARVQRDMRNRQIADEHITNPQMCADLDNQQAITIAAGQSWKVATGIENVSDPRGEAYPGQPAYYGSAQAVQAIAQLHLQRYCSQPEADAGLCTVSQVPNADQRATSLFQEATLDSQDAVNAANDFTTNLIQPIVPAALRGDQLTSVMGQDEAVRRRSYNARMSLAHSILDYIIAVFSPSVPLSDLQKQQMTNQGLTPVDKASWIQALTLDVERRYSDVNYAAQLQAMPPATVQREIATELAETNYIMLQTYKTQLLNASSNAATLAASTEKNYSEAVQMPTPSMSSN